MDSRALWVFVAIAGLYGLTECVYGNWGIVFLTEERGLGPATAGAALACFWAALSVGRLAVAGLLLRLRPAPVLPALAALMALACLLVPLARTPRGAFLLFALGGAGCSAAFPLALALACRRFPKHRSWVSSAMFAALVTGLGAGSFATGLLKASLDLASIYRIAALPPAIAGLLAFALARRPAAGPLLTAGRPVV
jgi:fucose permease